MASTTSGVPSQLQTLREEIRWAIDDIQSAKDHELVVGSDLCRKVNRLYEKVVGHEEASYEDKNRCSEMTWCFTMPKPDAHHSKDPIAVFAEVNQFQDGPNNSCSCCAANFLRQVVPVRDAFGVTIPLLNDVIHNGKFLYSKLIEIAEGEIEEMKKGFKDTLEEESEEEKELLANTFIKDMRLTVGLSVDQAVQPHGFESANRTLHTVRTPNGKAFFEAQLDHMESVMEEGYTAALIHHHNYTFALAIFDLGAGVKQYVLFDSHGKPRINQPNTGAYIEICYSKEEMAVILDELMPYHFLDDRQRQIEDTFGVHFNRLLENPIDRGVFEHLENQGEFVKASIEWARKAGLTLGDDQKEKHFKKVWERICSQYQIQSLQEMNVEGEAKTLARVLATLEVEDMEKEPNDYIHYVVRLKESGILATRSMFLDDIQKPLVVGVHSEEMPCDSNSSSSSSSPSEPHLNSSSNPASSPNDEESGGEGIGLGEDHYMVSQSPPRREDNTPSSLPSLMLSPQDSSTGRPPGDEVSETPPPSPPPYQSLTSSPPPPVGSPKDSKQPENNSEQKKAMDTTQMLAMLIIFSVIAGGAVFRQQLYTIIVTSYTNQFGKPLVPQTAVT